MRFVTAQRGEQLPRTAKRQYNAEMRRRNSGLSCTGHPIYAALARSAKSPANRQVLEQMAADERRHYRFWRTHTGQDVRPERLKMQAGFVTALQSSGDEKQNQS
jgi:demethoxyubiquinone hydroxylase (CLK1/Coq7/Cat5 family)